MAYKQILAGGLFSALIAGSACAADTRTADTRVVEAEKAHQKDVVLSLLKEHADASAPEPDGTTALHWAAHWNDAEAAAALLKAGVSAKAENRYGVTPLSEAAANGSEELVEALLKAGASANTLTTSKGETVLMTASRAGNVAAVKALLAHGADPNAKEDVRGQTALMWAAAENHADVIRLLAKKGADLNVRSQDRDATPPKMMAGTPVAPIYRGGLTALVFAARQGAVDAVNALLAAGADINQGDVDGNTPLIIAILNQHYDLAQVLIDRGANPNTANKDGRSPLYSAIDMHDEDWAVRPDRKDLDKLTSMDIVKSLLAHRADVNAQLKAPSPIRKFTQDQTDRNLAAGATAFMRAARAGDVETMHLLLDHGADPKLANKDGLNALLLAAGVAYADSVTRGSEPDALAAVKLCVELGFDVNAATDKGETAMHGATRRGANSIIQFLSEKGGNVNAQNKTGLTPLDLAMGKGGNGAGLGLVKETTAALLKQLGGGPGKEIKTVAKAE